MGRKKQSPFPAYLKWRNGRPRWDPGPKVRAEGFSGRDLKDETGRWLGMEAACKAADAINAEVAAARAGGLVRRRRAPQKPQRTCRALYDSWRKTPEFQTLAPTTRADYVRKAEIWLSDAGDEPVRALSRAVLKAYWRLSYEQRGHAMANGLLAVVRTMLTHATDLDWLEVNPAFKLKLMTVQPRVAFWSGSKVAAFVATADAIEPEIGDAVVIALHSAQRQGDVLAMPPRIFADGRVKLTQFKTGALVDAPMTPQLAARITAIRERWRAAGIVSRATIVADPRSGEAYTADRFRHRFAEIRAEASQHYPGLAAAERMQPGLADLRFQDLRDTAVTRLALAGCSLPQIAAITGHKDLDHCARVIKHYLATTDALADQAVAKLTDYLTTQGIAL